MFRLVPSSWHSISSSPQMAISAVISASDHKLPLAITLASESRVRDMHITRSSLHLLRIRVNVSSWIGLSRAWISTVNVTPCKRSFSNRIWFPHPLATTNKVCKISSSHGITSFLDYDSRTLHCTDTANVRIQAKIVSVYFFSAKELSPWPLVLCRGWLLVWAVARILPKTPTDNLVSWAACTKIVKKDSDTVYTIWWAILFPKQINIKSSVILVMKEQLVMDVSWRSIIQ